MSFGEPTIEGITEIYRQYNEARELRLSTGMWLRITELRLRDADQMPALMEHIEREPKRWHPSLGPVPALFGIPVIHDAEVPPSTARIVYEDGSVLDHPLA